MQGEREIQNSTEHCANQGAHNIRSLLFTNTVWSPIPVFIYLLWHVVFQLDCCLFCLPLNPPQIQHHQHHPVFASVVSKQNLWQDLLIPNKGSKKKINSYLRKLLNHFKSLSAACLLQTMHVTSSSGTSAWSFCYFLLTWASALLQINISFKLTRVLHGQKT